MTSSEDHNDLLIRWMDGTLNEDERKSFEASSEFQEYESIIHEVGRWELPTLDIQTSYANLRDQLPEARVINWYQTTTFRIAATITLLAIALSYVFLFNAKERVETGLAETQEYFLPDSSKVVLEPLSSIEFDADNWSELRSLKLDGKVYFDVKKGPDFVVTFGEDLVEVLGTTFEITSYENYKEVLCYSGKVKATISQSVFELTAGQGVNSISGSDPELIEMTGVKWSKNRVHFEKVPLSVVLESLEKHFGLTINVSGISTNRTYTGAFLTNNVDNALDMVLGTMNIDYEKNGETVTLR